MIFCEIAARSIDCASARRTRTSSSGGCSRSKAIPATSAVGAIAARNVGALFCNAAHCAGATRLKSSDPDCKSVMFVCGSGTMRTSTRFTLGAPRQYRGFAAYRQPIAARPRDVRERPIADGRRGVEGRARERALRREHVFRQHVLRARPVREERRDGRRPRFTQMKADRQRIRRLRAIDAVVAFVRRHGIRRVKDGAQRKEHVLRRDRHAVAPANAGPQMIDEGPAIGREPAVRHGRNFPKQLRNEAAAGIHIEERLEREVRERLFDVPRIGVREERIEVRRVRGDVETHGRNRRRRGVPTPGCGESERQERGPGPKPWRHCAHLSPSVTAGALRRTYVVQ